MAEAGRVSLPAGYYLVGVKPAAATATFQRSTTDLGSVAGLVRKAADGG